MGRRRLNRPPSLTSRIDYPGMAVAYYGGIDWVTKRRRKNSNGVDPAVMDRGLLADTFVHGNAANVDLGNALGATGPLTLIFWFYLSSVDGNLDTVISIGDRCTLRMDSYKFYTYDGSGYQEVEFGSGATGAGWYRLACIHTGTTNTLMGYGPNGNFVTVSGAANPRNTATQTLRFGADSENGRSFNGKGVLALGLKRATSVAEARSLLDMPWQAWKDRRPQLFLLAPPAAAAQVAAAQTLAGVSQAATAAAIVSMPGTATAFDAQAFDWQAFDVSTLAQTVDGVSQTATAVGVTTASATAAQTSAGVSQTATATIAAAASAAQTAAGVSQAATATVRVVVTAAQALANVAQASTLSSPAGLVGAQTLAPVTQAATAASPARASAVQTLADVSQTATAFAVPAGMSAAQTLAGVSQTATATVSALASAVQTLDGISQAATLATPARATAAQTLTNVTQTAAATLAAPGASATQTTADVTQTATAATPAGATAAQTLEGVSQAANATAGATATATQTLGDVTQIARVSTTSIDYEAMAAAVWAFVLPNGKTAAETAVETLALLEALSDAPGCLDVPIEGIFTGGDLLRVIAAVQAGKSTIASSAPGTATVEFRAIDDSVTRVSADMVGSERADVEINAAD